jgi:hypothetical protein
VANATLVMSAIGWSKPESAARAGASATGAARRSHPILELAHRGHTHREELGPIFDELRRFISSV